jgi:hypothetical protein
MRKSEEKIEKIREYLSIIYRTFEKRPGMLGTPEEVCAVLNCLDRIVEILNDNEPSQAGAEVYWGDFLVEKRLIVGAENRLKKVLRENAEDYSYLQELRQEYLHWRKTKGLENSNF